MSTPFDISLPQFVPSGQPPLHVALLPDGGRRWAVEKCVSLGDSYSYTTLKLYEVSKELFNCGCDRISIMLSSYGNHRLRNDTEVDTMNSRIFEFVQKCLQDARKDFGCEVEVLVPKDIAREIGIEPTPLWIARAVAKRRLLALFVGYDPTMEILTAIEDTRARRENLNRFHEYLWGNRPVDLLIRTGGYQVLSGFLPLATSYSRLFFLRELFNDVPTAAFEAIVGQFLNVPRLYGS